MEEKDQFLSEKFQGEQNSPLLKYRLHTVIFMAECGIG